MIWGLMSSYVWQTYLGQLIRVLSSVYFIKSTTFVPATAETQLRKKHEEPVLVGDHHSDSTPVDQCSPQVRQVPVLSAILPHPLLLQVRHHRHVPPDQHASGHRAQLRHVWQGAPLLGLGHVWLVIAGVSAVYGYGLICLSLASLKGFAIGC